MADELNAKKHTALSGWPMAIAWLGMIIFAFQASTHMVGAGDTWVAMACGRHFINHGVDTVEPFSANSHKPGPTEAEVRTWPRWAQWLTEKFGMETVKKWHPTGWVNQNWLTHVMFYWLTHLSPFADADPDNGVYCYNNVVYWKITIYVLSIICVYYIGRILGVNPALSAAFACLALFTGRSFFDIRPAGFSNLLVAVFLLILVLATYRHVLYIWLIVPLAVFWCNVHGGYIYVFIMLVPFAVLHFLASFFPRRFVSIGRRGVYHTVAAAVVAFIASIVLNPFHLTNLTHTFVISVSKHAKMWRTVHEWWPAFAWSNPVGTGFPLLVVFILSIGLFVLWLFSRFLMPRSLKAPRSELEAQRRLFGTLGEVFSWVLAVLICWVTFISLSFCRADLGSLSMCALFISIVLLSIRKNVYFAFLLVPLSLLVMVFADRACIQTLARWLSAPQWLESIPKGHGGRYILPFVLLPAYAITHLIVSAFRGSIKIKPLNVLVVLGAALLSLILMVLIFNPFNFPKISEGFGMYLRHFLDIHRPWRGAYEANLPHLTEAYNAHLFTGLYVANVVSLAVLFLQGYIKKPLAGSEKLEPQQNRTDEFKLPKFDIAFIVVAALTVYMAIRSRRFIPIAAFAACPVIAMFIDQMARTIAAARSFHSRGKLSVGRMSVPLEHFFAVTGTVVVLFLGTYWALEFKRVYLDPWPTNTKLNSVFMRMTASDVKPFFACKFIKHNKLSGKMFNYWTEGGFIAYGQEPDPNTGKTPLQLFMDGRAQAAYQPAAFRLWSSIMGGTVEGAKKVQAARMRRRKLTIADYIEIGGYITKELRSRGVWVVLMPLGGASGKEVIMPSLEYHPDWRVVFVNDAQELFVDFTTERGKELFDGIFNGKTFFPDEQSRNLTIAYNLLRYNDDKMQQEALEHAIQAAREGPSRMAIKLITDAAAHPGLKAEALRFFREYFDDFEKNKDTYIRQDGLEKRILGVVVSAKYLRSLALHQKNTQAVQYFTAKINEYESLRQKEIESMRW